jgi:hypothetical protein
MEDLIPSSDTMMGWITEVFDQGIRRPGFPADEWAVQWVRDHFESFGLKDIKLDPVTAKSWKEGDCSLSVWPADNQTEAIEVPCFPVPFSTSTDGVEAELIDIGKTEELPGKIAVLNYSLIPAQQSIFRDLATRFYDPDDDFSTLAPLTPFSLKRMGVMDPALEGGAAGFIGILDLPWETHYYYLPYDTKERPIHGVWVSPANGKQINELMDAGPVKARFSYKATLGEVNSHNISATLPGASDEWIIFNSHHDGAWASAVEDASGMAMVLAQAKYWSQIPESQRPHNMLFSMTAGHLAGQVGMIAFAERNRELIKDKAVLTVNLEHMARDSMGENGVLVPLDGPTPRIWYVSRITILEDALENAIVAEDLRRSLVLAPDALKAIIPMYIAPVGDGAMFHLLGAPTVQIVNWPTYLLMAEDTPEMVHLESLVPITRAVIRIVNDIGGQTAAGLKSQVRQE